MFEYRQILVRMRQGESDRELAKARLIGRKTAKGLRALAAERGWLDAQLPVPEDSELAAVLSTKRAQPPAGVFARTPPRAGQGLGR